MIPFLLACTTPQLTDPSVELGSPTNWFYAEEDGSIDWSSLAFVGKEVRFETLGHGLRTGPIAEATDWAGAVACDAATTLTLAFERGKLDRVTSFPRSPCVEDNAAELAWAWLRLDDQLLADTTHAILVLDIPEGACDSSC